VTPRLIASQLWVRKRRLAGMVAAIFLGVSFLAGTLALGDTLSVNFNRLFTTATAGTSAVVRNASTVASGVNATRPPIPASLVATVRAVPGVAAAQPLITGTATLLGSNGKAIGGLGPPRSGSNWISDPALTPYRLAAGHPPVGLNQVVIDRGAATTGRLRIGSVATVLTPAPVRVTIVGLATFGTADSFGGAPYVAFSLAGAQKYLSATQPGTAAGGTGGPAGGSGGPAGSSGGPGAAGGAAARVNTIQVSAAPGVSPETLVARLDRALPPGVQAITGGQLTQQNLASLGSEFLTALRIFLVTFAGIAMLVAAFSIASTFGIVIAQRTREAALLRALGATRRQIFGQVLGEALVIGAIGSALGLLGGVAIAGLLKGLFDSFGFALPAGGLVMSGTSITVAVLTGLAVTLAVSLVPAVRAARVSPLAALRESAAESARPSRARAIGGALLVAAGLLAVFAALRGTGNRVLTGTGLGALLLTLGVVVLGPVVARPVTGLLGRPLAAWRGVTGSMARRGAMRSPRRSAAAATALMIGVAVVSLFTVYAASLKSAEIGSVSDSVTADIAVSSGRLGADGLPPAIVKPLSRVPGVATVGGLAGGRAAVAGKEVDVTATGVATIGRVLSLHPVAGTIAGLGRDQIAVSQVQATTKHWAVGTRLPMVMPDGTRMTVTIGAIYASRGVVGDYLLPLPLWAAHAPQLTASVMFVKLAPGASPAAVQAAISRVTAGYGKPTVEDRAAYIAATARPLNTILSIVYVLLVLAIIIAMFGIANTASLSVHERTQELGLLRAVGQTRRQIRSMVRLESVIVSAFGTVGGLVLGVFAGWALAEAGARAQGLTSFTLPASQLIVIFVLGVLTGVVAAVRPARRAARLPLLAAISTQ
jgi:putative ABC transport system permease protein